jgi:PEP-CTERM motif
MRRFLLIMALAVTLFLPGVAAAETITGIDPEGTILTIPDGSTVTDIYWNSLAPEPTAPGSYGGIWVVDFSFADGTGVEAGDYIEGEGGQINFTEPVSNLDLTFDYLGSNYVISASDGEGAECGPPPLPTGPASCPASPLSLDFEGPDITSLSWETGEGYAGIDSMTYSTPEPGTALFMVAGLATIAGLSLRRKRSPHPSLPSQV